MEKIDIAMTAALRPKVLNETLSSLTENMVWDGGFRLVIDVAPVPEFRRNKVKQETIINTAKKHIQDIKFRMLEESKYSEAMKWVWRNTESNYILQWEDDWKLLRKVYLKDVIDFMKENNVGMVYFDRARKSVLTHKPYKKSFNRFNLSFWERVDGKSIGGPPALLNQDYVRDMLKIMDDTIAPDLLSRKPEIREKINKWKIFVYIGEDLKGNLVFDIGKKWKLNNNIVMTKNTPRGVTWKQKI